MHLGFLFFFPAVLVGIAVLVTLIVLATRTYSSPPRVFPPAPTAPPSMRETPLEILARRFASGEITAEEYQKARDLLRGGSEPAS
jgi:uncharacterized membrane protein